MAVYTITYNANGGYGAPSKQTKWSGVNLTLSSSRPTRSGYIFQGWATSSSGSVVYAAGATYTANASVTLYAVWGTNVYPVNYNANGGTGAPASQSKRHGTNLILSGVRPTRTNYTFKGWGTSPASTTVTYLPGGTYSTNAGITLYAIWELSYTVPTIIGFFVDRCNSDGVSSEMGTCAKVIFSWRCEQPVTQIKIEWKLSNETSYYSETVSGSGTGGNVIKVIGGGNLDTESLYNIRVTVSDGSGSSSETKNLSQTKYVIDVLAGGDGIAFGKPADRVGFDINMDVWVQGRKLLDLIHPINSVYISYSHESPESLFGGRWVRMSNAFLWGCNEGESIGTKGGSKTHALTTDELPTHTHLQTEHAHWLPYTANASGASSMGKFVVSEATNSTNGKGFTSNLATLNATATNENTGGNNAHNNMPPYIVVSIWRRIE